MPRRESQTLIARRHDGRPISRPVPAWILAVLALVCLALVGFSVYALARFGHVNPAGLPGIAGLFVIHRAWKANSRV